MTHGIDLASRALGGTVMGANDESFAAAHHLIDPDPPRHDPAEFDPRGKVYDGWETRRRREPGQRLRGRPARRARHRPRRRHRHHATSAATTRRSRRSRATTLLGYPSYAEVCAADWTPLLARTPLTGDASNAFAVEGPDRLVTHVRLTIDPDGGVARFRVHGEVVPDPRRLGGRPDLAALANGGRVEDCSNLFYANPANCLAPGRARVMSDGWETARRRDDGNDWVVVRLGAPGVLHEAVHRHVAVRVQRAGLGALTDAETGAELLPRTRLQPDTEHVFRLAAAPAVRLARLDIYPDGGLSRLRLHGTVPAEEQDAIAQRWLGLLPAELAAPSTRPTSSPDPHELSAPNGSYPGEGRTTRAASARTAIGRRAGQNDATGTSMSELSVDSATTRRAASSGSTVSAKKRATAGLPS